MVDWYRFPQYQQEQDPEEPNPEEGWEEEKNMAKVTVYSQTLPFKKQASTKTIMKTKMKTNRNENKKQIQ